MKSAKSIAAVSFIADMARELATMARKTQQSNLAYLLDVAALEAQRAADSSYADFEDLSPEAMSRH